MKNTERVNPFTFLTFYKEEEIPPRFYDLEKLGRSGFKVPLLAAGDGKVTR